MFYTQRALLHLDAADKQTLRDLGFPLPSQNCITACTSLAQKREVKGRLVERAQKALIKLNIPDAEADGLSYDA